MDSIQFELKNLRADITKNHLQLKAVIQDITDCTGPLAELQNLNSLGRSKISSVRKLIDKFGDVAKELKNQELLKEVVLEREQLASNMDNFKKANLKSMLTIEKGNKEELLRQTADTEMKHRIKRDKATMAKMNSNVTDQLFNISRQLAETTKQSARTLDNLAVSSETIQSNHEELKVTSGTITKSGKLLNKYGRREITDKIVLVFGFFFFLVCVMYIIQKRIL